MIAAADGRVDVARYLASPNCDERPPGAAITLLVIHNISLPPGEFGGDGIVREVEVLTESEVTILSDRRKRGPYGLRGASDGAPGRTEVLRRDGSVEELKSKDHRRLAPGERVRVSSPGGGGWGK